MKHRGYTVPDDDSGERPPQMTSTYRAATPMFVLEGDNDHYLGMTLDGRSVLVAYPKVAEAIAKAEGMGAGLVIKKLSELIVFCRQADWDLALSIGGKIYRVSNIVTSDQVTQETMALGYELAFGRAGDDGQPVAL